MPKHRLDPLMNPRSVAYVGASETPGSPGYELIQVAKSCGYACTRDPSNPKDETGQVITCDGSLGELPAAPREEAERLASLGYVSGSVEPVTDDIVTVHDRARAWAGLNLYNSGHAPEAFLVDMDGNVIHRWGYRFVDVWPEAPVDDVPRNMRDWWRRVQRRKWMPCPVGPNVM